MTSGHVSELPELSIRANAGCPQASSYRHTNALQQSKTCSGRPSEPRSWIERDAKISVHRTRQWRAGAATAGSVEEAACRYRCPMEAHSTLRLELLRPRGRNLGRNLGRGGGGGRAKVSNAGGSRGVGAGDVSTMLRGRQGRRGPRYDSEVAI